MAKRKTRPPLRLEYRTARELSDNPANWRRHPEHQKAALRDVIDSVGWAGVVLVNERTGRMIDGHARKAIARRGERIPVLVGSWTEAQERTILATLDPLAALAETDAQALHDLLAQLDGQSDAVNSMLAELADDNPLAITPGAGGDEFDVEAALPTGPTRTQAGDLWLIGGRHRLLIGDCTQRENVERVLDGGRARICFTSPPYNIGSNAIGGNASMVDSKYISNSDDSIEWIDLMTSSISEVLTFCDFAVINVQMLAGNKTALLEWFFSFKSHFADFAIWHKPAAAPAMARSVMNSCFEFLVMLSAENDPNRAIPYSDFHGTVPNVYVGHGASNDNVAPEIHAATMPLHLPTWVLGTLCSEAESVYDPFAGTGTTLVAAHRLGRVCHGCEIEPRYGDVILARAEAEGLSVEKLV